MKTLVPGHEHNYINFVAFMVDEHNQRLNKTVRINSNTFEGDFLIQAASNKDIFFDVISIVNYKQVDFSINGSKKGALHRIFIPKTTEKRLRAKKINISFDNIEGGFNDGLLIFSAIGEQPFFKKSFVARFTFVNESKQGDCRVSYSSDFNVIDGELDYPIFVFNKEFQKITENLYDNYKVVKRISYLKAGQIIKLPTCISIKQSIIGSPSFNDYLEDAKTKKTQPIAFIAILNGRLQPLFYNEPDEENVKFYEVKCGDTIMITPKIKVTKKGSNKLTLIVLPYPFTYPEELLYSYKMANWSTCIVSNEIVLDVSN